MKNLTSLRFLILASLMGAFMSCQNSSEPQNNSSTQNTNAMNTEKLIIGTYTNQGTPESKGIYLTTRDIQSGDLSLDSLLVYIDNPNFQAVSPDGEYLYSVSETAEKGGSVFAYKIQPDHTLKLINKQPSLGRSACHVAVNKAQSMLFVTNYSSGVFTVYHLGEDGSISEPVQHYEYEGSGPHANQGSSHPHQTTISPNQKYVYVADLGSDEIHMYRIDTKTDTLTDLDPSVFKLPPGSGPRHMTFHPDQPFAYVITELANTIQAMKWDENSGSLTAIELYPTLPDDYDGESYCADIHISSDGKFLYGSNRGHNSLVIYRIDSENGELEQVGFSSVHGDWPRNFYISDDGKNVYVANQRSGNISSFNRDQESGKISLIDSSFTDTYSPVCITEIKM